MCFDCRKCPIIHESVRFLLALVAIVCSGSFDYALISQYSVVGINILIKSIGETDRMQPKMKVRCGRLAMASYWMTQLWGKTA